MPRHHVIISGTGRAGTTLLVQLLTRLGLETGYTSLEQDYFSNCHAGLERDLRDPASPYVVKSPRLCGQLGELLATDEIVIDPAIIPMRDLFSAVESRRDVMRRTAAEDYPDGIPGGLWHTSDPQQQEAVLARQFYRLLHVLAVFREVVRLELIHSFAETTRENFV